MKAYKDVMTEKAKALWNYNLNLGYSGSMTGYKSDTEGADLLAEIYEIPIEDIVFDMKEVQRLLDVERMEKIRVDSLENEHKTKVEQFYRLKRELGL